MSQRRARWGEPEPKPTPEQNASQTRSSWGNPELDPREELERKPTAPLPPADGVIFPSRPAAEPVPFPLPGLQDASSTDPERKARSNAWLETLTQPSEKLRALPRHIHRAPERTKPRWRKLTPLRVLIVGLGVVLALALILFSIPGLRQAALGLFTPAETPSANTATQGTLVAHSNIAGSVLKLRDQPYQMTDQSKDIWSVTIPHLEKGSYAITISAPNYTPASGQVQIVAQQQNIVTAFLTVNGGLFTTLLSPSHDLIVGKPLAATIPTGTQFLNTQTATQPLTVSIDYRVSSLVDKPEPSVLESGSTVAPPLMLISGVVTPDIRFTDATTGALIAEATPASLPASHFLVALAITFDNAGGASFILGSPPVLKATNAADAPIAAPGGVAADPALLFALVSLALDQGSSAGTPVCIGLLDALNGSSQPDPEDGFLFGINGSTAHYFYRWGQLWTTNAAAHSLTPDLPQADANARVQAQSLIDAGQNGQATGCTS